MLRMYSFNNNIYSIDMMFAYINIFKPKHISMDIKDLLHNLEYKDWGDPIKNILYSPLEVLKKPNKYSDDFERIEETSDEERKY